jgi:hypothetical protein
MTDRKSMIQYINKNIYHLKKKMKVEILQNLVINCHDKGKVIREKGEGTQILTKYIPDTVLVKLYNSVFNTIQLMENDIEKNYI